MASLLGESLEATPTSAYQMAFDLASLGDEGLVTALLPLLVMLVSMQVFVSTLIFWVIIGFAFVSYVQSTLLRPVFRQLEAPDGPNVQLMD